jgi:hypothetical protein|nr:MAG TPA: hypothetical protein [Caudoviricetes sp.]
MADLFAPRKILTAHLQTLVERGVLRYVGQHHELEQVFDGQPAQHLGAYVAFDKYSDVSVQARNQKMTQHYTVILAVQNNRPARSGAGSGMDEAGEVLATIMSHVEGLRVDSGTPDTTPGYGKRFTLAAADSAFYRPGWAFYPVSFAIDIINLKDTP